MCLVCWVDLIDLDWVDLVLFCFFEEYEWVEECELGEKLGEVGDDEEG